MTKIIDFLNQQPDISQENKEYFRLRAQEFARLIKAEPFAGKGLQVILEIGCGSGFISALLSRYSNKVIAIDLPFKDSLSHSQGLDQAQRLIGTLNLQDKVEIKDGRAEDIPCTDNSIDLVYSHFVFDHIIDFPAAFKEINRILKDNGLMITIVPNALDKILWFKYYLTSGGLIKNYLRPFYNFFCKKMSFTQCVGSFYWLAPPHDRRFSFLEELKRYRITSWKKMFSDNNHRINSIVPIRDGAVAFFTQKLSF